MEYKRVSAMAVAALFALTSCAWVISAEEDEGAPVIITAPADGAETISCAVFFADNMVYTPQWRLDNYVRIEVMVLNMDGLADPSELLVSATDLYPSIYTDGLAQQAAIIANSAEVLPLTKMVSVSYISVTITSDMLDEPIVLEAGWDTVTLAKVIDNGFGREVNKAGHLIYGTLWDTTGLSEGDYTTEIRLGVAKQDALGNWYGDVGEWYDVNYAIGHLYNPEVEGEYLVPDHPYDDLDPPRPADPAGRGRRQRRRRQRRRRRRRQRARRRERRRWQRPRRQAQPGPQLRQVTQPGPETLKPLPVFSSASCALLKAPRCPAPGPTSGGRGSALTASHSFTKPSPPGLART